MTVAITNLYRRLASQLLFIQATIGVPRPPTTMQSTNGRPLGLSRHDSTIKRSSCKECTSSLACTVSCHERLSTTFTATLFLWPLRYERAHGRGLDTIVSIVVYGMSVRLESTADKRTRNSLLWRDHGRCLRQRNQEEDGECKERGPGASRLELLMVPDVSRW
ncbi:uncharacterized protein C8Q71DRAFT_568153 [Rhodofomes roseus]|uniref:Uncharacterized protein n=1 Tax=Rhodofomes roseus TaxID=34475 RepID=A0ABQ8KKE0_9APHY|nr:uncharacterized protein C8Q71DRAFT_568153 [Rhodofomes roseus]KAH9837909.1 hypothetical protein C8Q71DRAFT_568153 [Rhodofomes roseus]